MKKKYNYFYKITNNINNHFYYGVHTTNNLNDGYMGSGTRLKYAYKKYGIENFSKKILKFFETSEEAFQYESDMLTETLVKDTNCYNIKFGGKGWNTCGLATVKDMKGKCFDVPVDEPRLLSGELVGITKGLGVYKDADTGKYIKTFSTDERIVKNEIIPFGVNMIVMRDDDNNIFYLDKTDINFEEEVKKRGLVFISTGKVTVKDKSGKYYRVDVDDKDYLSGKLSAVWKDRKHSDRTKEKMRKTHKQNKHQQGSKNSQYGTCWVYKIIENKCVNKKIKKDEIEHFLNDGWYKGRKFDKDFSEKIKKGMRKK